MRLLTDTKTIGITVKLVIEVDEDQAQQLLDALPSDITFGGERLWNVRIGIRGSQMEPVRVALAREDMTMDDEDTFLENA
jgi:hypothetical protein